MSKIPKASRTVRSILNAHEDELRRRRSSTAFSGSGMTVTAPGQFEIDGDVTVTGNFTAEGKINNDALVNPVAAGAIFDSLTNFSLSTTLTNIRTTTLTVPTGFTSAAISVVARCYAVNPRSTGGYDGLGGDYLYCQANIAGFNGYALPLPVSGSGGSGFNVSPYSTVLSGLTPGAHVLVQIAAATNYASWTANVANTAEVSGSVMWFR